MKASMSQDIPVKSENVFHPDVILNTGHIRIPFWKNLDIYKGNYIMEI